MKIYLAFKYKEYESVIVGAFDDELKVKELIDKKDADFIQEMELNKYIG